ncbi:MAG: hypothetical protein WCS31_02525 [Verrucomicrobiae bacterium]
MRINITSKPPIRQLEKRIRFGIGEHAARIEGVFPVQIWEEKAERGKRKEETLQAVVFCVFPNDRRDG